MLSGLGRLDEIYVDKMGNWGITTRFRQITARMSYWIIPWYPDVSEQARARHNTSSIKFGVTLSKLVATDSNRAGFKSVIKNRKAAGVLYTFDIAGMQREMVEKHWVTSDVDPQPIADT
jgi:hypothetical protein